MFCSSVGACLKMTIRGAKNIYCNGYQSCLQNKLIDIDKLFVTGYWSAVYITAYNIHGNIYCTSLQACSGWSELTVIKNVTGNIIASGVQSLGSSSISNVFDGTIYVIGLFAMDSAVIENANKVVVNSESLHNSLLKNITEIEIYGNDALKS